jgi:predicted HD phosphohydrolase
MKTNQTVSFTRMSEGTAEDFRIVAANDALTAQDLPDRLIEHLQLMADDDGAYQVDRLEHLLQTATRCERDGGDDDWIVASLMHYLGDVLAPFSHAEVSAEILRPFVREEVYWAVKHHGIFQNHYNKSLSEEKRQAREQFRGSPHYQATIDFCQRWDQCSFDPNYESEPLDHFVPVIRRVFTRKPNR